MSMQEAPTTVPPPAHQYRAASQCGGPPWANGTASWGGGGRGGNDGWHAPVHVKPPASGAAWNSSATWTLQAGEVVDVFHRYCQDPNGYFMVDNGTRGLLHPSVGRTDGWTEGRVNRNWSADAYDPRDMRTWVEIRWSHPLWYNRRGHKLDVSKPSMITQKVPMEQVRRKGQASEAQERPCLTLLHVRWGGMRPVDPVTEGAGGWGQIGSNPSDNYINGWETRVYEMLGPTYEIISVFIQRSEELAKIPVSLLRHLMSGEHVGALYFMWPIMFQDGHNYPAYVERDREYELMVSMEAAGIPTRFPHPAHIYRIFASKEWSFQMCLHPLFQVPLTTSVSRQAVATNPSKAAATALRALSNLSHSRAAWSWEMQQESKPAGPIKKGVAKLGYSWEAMDVQVWNNTFELSNALSTLSQQPGSLVDLVLVQEWVDFDVEMRHFVVEPDLDDPESWKPKKIVYTIMKHVQDNRFREFDRFGREGCLHQCFKNDDAALASAEEQAEKLIGRWLHWLQAQTHELPTVVRFDILAKHSGPGQAVVTTGELTELGGCFLGWEEGPEVVFSAMCRSCFKDRAELK